MNTDVYKKRFNSILEHCKTLSESKISTPKDLLIVLCPLIIDSNIFRLKTEDEILDIASNFYLYEIRDDPEQLKIINFVTMIINYNNCIENVTKYISKLTILKEFGTILNRKSNWIKEVNNVLTEMMKVITFFMSLAESFITNNDIRKFKIFSSIFDMSAKNTYVQCKQIYLDIKPKP